MKRRLCLILFALSLALNVGTLVRTLRGTADDKSSPKAKTNIGNDHAPAPRRSGVETSVPAKVAETNSPIIARARTAEEIRAMAERLQSFGLPRYIVRDTLVALLAHEEAEREVVTKVPYWQISGLTQLSVEQKLRSKQQSIVDAALGFGAADVRTPLGQHRRFGDLPPEKIAAVLKIERDYRELVEAQHYPNGTLSPDERARSSLIGAARRADIVAALSADELAQYDRRNSPGAQQVISAVSGAIEITEDEFTALSKLHERFLADRLNHPNETAPDHAQIRAILPDDRFYAYLAGADPVYQTIDQFARTQPGLAPPKAYELYRLQRAAWDVRNVAGIDSADGKRQLAALNAQLEILLGRDGAKAYRTRSAFGGIFNFSTSD